MNINWGPCTACGRVMVPPVEEGGNGLCGMCDKEAAPVKRKKHVVVGRHLLAARNAFHKMNWTRHRSVDNAAYLEALKTVLGAGTECLFCGEGILDRNGEVTVKRDLDQWFCSSCCPVCNSEDYD